MGKHEIKFLEKKLNINLAIDETFSVSLLFFIANYFQAYYYNLSLLLK